MTSGLRDFASGWRSYNMVLGDLCTATARLQLADAQCCPKPATTSKNRCYGGGRFVSVRLT